MSPTSRLVECITEEEVDIDDEDDDFVGGLVETTMKMMKIASLRVHLLLVSI
jgi:hypothetical protein